MSTTAHNMEVTQRIEFECCYLFYGVLEAHRCKMEVTVAGPQRFEDHGVVITYAALQDYMKQVVPDRSFVYCRSDPSGLYVGKAFQDVNCSVKEYDFPISAENLCKHFAEELQDLFDVKEPGIHILDMKLREDNNSFVSWTRGRE